MATPKSERSPNGARGRKRAVMDAAGEMSMIERMSLTLDPRIAAGSRPLAQLGLCEARLQDDVRFPWIVLVPRRTGLVEIADLDPAGQAQLWAETRAAGEAVRAIGKALGRPVAKLNHGQLGNVVAQLHVHVVGRRSDDAAWPGPVWGCGAGEPYPAAASAAAREAALRAIYLSGRGG